MGFPLIFICGPTAVGKTHLAFQIAKNQSCVLINSDSIQFYKELNIGSAKPDFSKHPSVKHFLFNTLEAPHLWTAGDFRREALKVLNQEMEKQACLVIGGSGFYLQALERGMYPLKPISESVKKEIAFLENNKELAFLYQELKTQDPEFAQKISPNDRYRILRSLAIIKNEKKTLSQIRRQFRPQGLKWPINKVGLQISKEDLLQRVQERTSQMIQKGLVEETKSLVQKGHGAWKPLQSVGYKETLLYLNNQITKEELFEHIVKNTMLLAKKQKTWFQKDKSIKWYSYKEDFLKIEKDFF